MAPNILLRKLPCRLFATIGLLLFQSFVYSSSTASGQPPEVHLEIQLSQNLTQAQTLSLARLGVDSRGAGARLLNVIIENRSPDTAGDLYLYVGVRVSGIGIITELDQQQGRPFSLRPFQVVRANNNDLQDGLPGVSESIRMDGEMTSRGEDFINSLEGSTVLPDRIYTVEVRIYHRANRLSGGTLLAETVATLPTQEFFTDLGFDLIFPGGPIATPSESILLSRPIFRWEGSTSQTYRIIVVEAITGETAQSLIQQALTTSPISGVDETGDLLEFEMADVVIRGNSFSYPSTTVQPLRPGRNYFWQVFTKISSPAGVEWYPSPVWHFRIQRASMTQTELEQELFELAQQFLPQQFRSMIMEGHTIESAEIDGRTVQGAQLLMELENILQKIEAGSIRILE